eukprot:415127-Amphidinium_carterae.1
MAFTRLRLWHCPEQFPGAEVGNRLVSIQPIVSHGDVGEVHRAGRGGMQLSLMYPGDVALVFRSPSGMSVFAWDVGVHMRHSCLRLLQNASGLLLHFRIDVTQIGLRAGKPDTAGETLWGITGRIDIADWLQTCRPFEDEKIEMGSRVAEFSLRSQFGSRLRYSPRMFRIG